MKRLVCLFVLASLALVNPSTLFAETPDWNQWRGPNRDGSVDASSWLKRWPRVRLKAKWSRNIGAGYSAPSIDGDNMICCGYAGGEDYVYSFKLDSGKPVWKYAYSAKNFDNMNAGGPAGTPCVYKGLVFVISREAKLIALEAKTGKLKWQKDLSADFGVKAPGWGFSGSPTISEGKLYVDVGVIASFEPKSGKLIWKTRNFGAGYSTPAEFNWQKKKYLAVFPAVGLVILDKASGKEISRFAWKTSYDVNAATPVIDGNLIFISTGYNTGCALVKFEGGKLSQVWRNKNMRNHMATSVIHKGFVYGFDEALLRCIDVKTGKSVWKKRGYGKGSLILARTKKHDVLVVLSDRGELSIAEASSKGFAPKVEKRVLKGSGCWSAPVIHENKLIVRNPAGELTCFELK